MFYLNKNSLKIRYAKRRYLKEMSDFVYRRIDTITSPTSITFINDFILDDLEQILVGTPKNLLRLHYFYNLKLNMYPELKKDIDEVFKYELFISKKKNIYDAYDLAQDLDISTCTYCNRNYTNTIITKEGQKMSRPQFDHYFDKKNYPLLKLSFFNLIPSCSICNSGIKLNKPFLLETHSHPYLDDIVDEFKFTYKYDNGNKSGLRINLKSDKNSKATKTLEDLELEEVYNANIDTLRDLIKIKQAYSDKYLSILSNQVLEGVNLSREELYRLAFGSQLSKDKLLERPFSKFKKDILIELKIISE